MTSRRLVAAIVFLVVAAGAAVVWRTGVWREWAARISSRTTASSFAPASNAAAAPVLPAPAKPADAPLPAVATLPAANAPEVSHAIAAADTVSGEDLALDSAGATIELVSNGYGAGPDGLKLLDGNPETSWTTSRDFFPLTLPIDIVVSFYKRQPALIQAVTITLSSEHDTAAPKDVEVWTSTASAADGFVQVAAAPLALGPKRQAITFAPIEARFVKLRIVSLQQPPTPRTIVALGGIGTIEASRAGYSRLAARSPDVADWVGSPRRAAQRGIEWLQPNVVKWQKDHECFGCHIQAQAMMGLTIASRNDYAVSEKTIRALGDYMVSQQKPDGTYVREPNEPSTLFAGMGLAYYDEWLRAPRNPVLLKTADYLVSRLKPTGEIPNGDPACGPHTVVQGPMMATVDTLVALHRAYDETQDARYKEAADRALAWASAAPAKTTQDQVFKILALTRYGGPSAKADVQGIVENLILQQHPSGGWRECPTETYQKDANPFSTGQVLYAFKQAGVSIGSSPFLKGVKYLLDTQHADGAWPADPSAMHTMTAEYAPTMWAIIGLAGSFGAVKAGGLQITAEQTPEQTAARRNIEIVLDASGSMKAALGKSTRIATARQVLRDVLAKIPDDFNVGLRVYARRYSARQKETCTDTELLRPIAKLDRQQISSMVDGIVPRGETPLVYSILQAPADLKAAGGGSLIVITDGEETCGGDPVKAAEQLKAAGMPITLNIVGFTLKGKNVEQQLTQFAEATGGHYYSAQDGEALSRALSRAALTRFPYTVYDAKGTQVASGLAGPLTETLPPGEYKVVVQAGDSEVTTNVTLAAKEEVTLRIVDRGDRWELVRKGS